MNRGHFFAKFGNFVKNTPKTLKLGYFFTFQETKRLFSSDLFVKNLSVFAFSLIFGFFASKIALPIGQTFAESPTAQPSSSDLARETKQPVQKLKKSSLPNIKNSDSSGKNPILSNSSTKSSASTFSSSAISSSGLYIPKIGLAQGVIYSPNAITPDYGVGRYGNLLFAHVYGVFGSLGQLRVGDKIYLDGKSYTVYSTGVYKLYNAKFIQVGQKYLTTSELANQGSSIITLMTCAGSYNSSLKTYSHRTLVFAKID